MAAVSGFFPLFAGCVSLLAMELSARQIRSAVLALRKSDGPEISGVRLRAFLKRRHGHPGSVSRVYRVLRETLSDYEQKRQPPPAPVVPVDVRALLAECQRLRAREAAAVERAERAEHREQVHQDKWLMEIDKLRQQLRELEAQQPRRSEVVEEKLQLFRELHAAKIRIAELTQELSQRSL